MFYTPINYPAVCLSAIASMAVGFIWYSPQLFQKPWMKYSKLDAKKMRTTQKHMKKTYGISFVTSLITAYAVALLLSAALVVNIWEGLLLGSLIWAGFVVTTLATGVLFQGVHWKLFLINSGYQLVSILVMSIILASWI